MPFGDVFNQNPSRHSLPKKSSCVQLQGSDFRLEGFRLQDLGFRVQGFGV